VQAPLVGGHPEDDILIVAPYNAQVAALSRSLPGFRIGTVDKFQGQEAPIVIYSLTTSIARRRPQRHGIPLQPEPPKRSHLPRKGNGHSSRQPGAPGTRIRSPRQLRLANALCRYAELSPQPPNQLSVGRLVTCRGLAKPAPWSFYIFQVNCFIALEPLAVGFCVSCFRSVC